MVEVPPHLISALQRDPPTLIAGHVNPDPDCLGSMFALAAGLEAHTGRQVTCALPPDSVSSRLEFLVTWAQPTLASAQQCAGEHTLAICDTAKQKRANLPAGAAPLGTGGVKIINIDHHASNTQFGDLNWVDPQASSTAELIYWLFKAAHWPFTPTIASMLFAGIHGDTLGFSLGTTSSSAFSAAAELVACGADVGRIGELLCRSQSESEFNLRRLIYDNTRLSATGRIAFSTANHQEITAAGCTAADIDDQVEIPRALDGATMAVLFSEGQPGKIRINLRSKGDISVLELAQQLGGGGHHAAAGAIHSGALEDALASVLPLAEQYLDRLAHSTAGK